MDILVRLAADKATHAFYANWLAAFLTGGFMLLVPLTAVPFVVMLWIICIARAFEVWQRRRKTGRVESADVAAAVAGAIPICALVTVFALLTRPIDLGSISSAATVLVCAVLLLYDRRWMSAV